MRSILFDPLDEVEGNWSREQLEAMDAAFIARVEAAFQAGLESRGCVGFLKMNGKQRADELAIELAWRWLRENMDAGVDISFSEVVGFVQARCPGVNPARIRFGFEQRFATTSAA